MPKLVEDVDYVDASCCIALGDAERARSRLLELVAGAREAGMRRWANAYERDLAALDGSS